MRETPGPSGRGSRSGMFMFTSRNLCLPSSYMLTEGLLSVDWADFWVLVPGAQGAFLSGSPGPGGSEYGHVINLTRPPLRRLGSSVSPCPSTLSSCRPLLRRGNLCPGTRVCRAIKANATQTGSHTRMLCRMLRNSSIPFFSSRCCCNAWYS